MAKGDGAAGMGPVAEKKTATRKSASTTTEVKATSPATAPAAARALEEGAKAPDFALPDDSGGTLSLASFAGKKLVLYFYPKDDTSGCTKEAIELEALRSEFEAEDAAILGVSPDSVASHVKFKAKYNLGFSLVSDEAKAMLAAYGVWVEKSMYGRKYMGVERTTFLIDPAGRIARIWRKVKVPGHAADVLAAVSKL
jgi:peroxiredoxin Q/BCP